MSEPFVHHRVNGWNVWSYRGILFWGTPNGWKSNKGHQTETFLEMKKIIEGNQAVAELVDANFQNDAVRRGP